MVHTAELESLVESFTRKLKESRDRETASTVRAEQATAALAAARNEAAAAADTAAAARCHADVSNAQAEAAKAAGRLAEQAAAHEALQQALARSEGRAHGLQEELNAAQQGAWGEKIGLGRHPFAALVTSHTLPAFRLPTHPPAELAAVRTELAGHAAAAEDRLAKVRNFCAHGDRRVAVYTRSLTHARSLPCNCVC
jgi:hypothetical protein